MAAPAPVPAALEAQLKETGKRARDANDTAREAEREAFAEQLKLNLELAREVENKNSTIQLVQSENRNLQRQVQILQQEAASALFQTDSPSNVFKIYNDAIVGALLAALSKWIRRGDYNQSVDVSQVATFAQQLREAIVTMGQYAASNDQLQPFSREALSLPSAYNLQILEWVVLYIGTFAAGTVGGTPLLQTPAIKSGLDELMRSVQFFEFGQLSAEQVARKNQLLETVRTTTENSPDVYANVQSWYEQNIPKEGQ